MVQKIPSPIIVLFAFLLDSFLADPQVRWHPVRLIGDIAEFFRKRFYSLGILGGAFTLFFTAAFFVGPVYAFTLIFPPLEIIFLYFFIAPTSLRREVLKVAHALSQNDLVLGRKRLSFLVGRETKNLSLSQCVRASVETLAENFTDAVVGPLFWYFILGIPGVAFYKVCETLDSMYGYKTEKWQRFGFFPAKSDDVLNFIPARIAALFIILASAFAGGSPARAMKTMLRDAGKHDSPNSGYTEAAMAGALGIELGGPLVYQGRYFAKSTFGKPLRERRVSDIFLAAKIVNMATILWITTLIIAEAFIWKSGYQSLIGLITKGLVNV
ncbi:adenosylcobinamide-phosphate synthase CbiB [Thermodesulfatator atlanticus]